ncbi:hypothetical protein K474DRAFT_1768481 [Panus rudis PR-1116 ss-1]|nr:hypothetical protein K474DRAFT_1768481 [Panus rudis PR-1116 ss-1]
MARASRNKAIPRPVSKKDASIKRWNTVDDIPLDDEDQFHASRDRILLDGEDVHSDDEGDEEEVFALKGMPEDDSDNDSQHQQQQGEDSDEDDEELQELKALAEASKKDTKKNSKKKSKKHADPGSDESAHSQSEEEEEEESWGRKKGEYYASNADLIDSEDEEANEMEEQEAKRLQAKAREALTDDDFGLTDDLGAATQKPPDDDILVEEPTPAPVTQLPQDKESILRYLEKTNPESLALARDWDDTAKALVKCQAKIAELEAESPDVLSLGMIHLYYQTLLTYTTTLSFYLHLRSLPHYTSNPEKLRTHPVMKRLLMLKQSVVTVEGVVDPLGEDGWDESDDDESDLSDDGLSEDGESGEGLSEDEDMLRLWQMEKELQNEELQSDHNKKKGKGKKEKKGKKERGMDPDELKALLSDADLLINDLESLKPSTKSKKSKKAKGSEGGKEEEEEEEERPKKKRKTKPDASLPVFDLEEPSFPSSSSSRTKPKPTSSHSHSSHDADPYGDPHTLHPTDILDKTTRTKSLRFHTSKIESTIGRRERARKGVSGGDDDIPWKERKREREERVRREVEKARKRELAQRGDVELDEVDPEEERNGGVGGKRKRGEEGVRDRNEGDEVDGYYDLVKRKGKEKKEKKKAEHDAEKAAIRFVPLPPLPQISLTHPPSPHSAALTIPETTSGPRSLTSTILSNKGLTPKRPKSVRNPRVKKRQKYEKAKKKVSSQKAVYKGGLAEMKGRYEGEKTGISTVVKSVKL